MLKMSSSDSRQKLKNNFSYARLLSAGNGKASESKICRDCFSARDDKWIIYKSLLLDPKTLIKKGGGGEFEKSNMAAYYHRLIKLVYVQKTSVMSSTITGMKQIKTYFKKKRMTTCSRIYIRD